jgi:hypothetical protein
MDAVLGVMITTVTLVVQGWTDLVWFLGESGSLFVLGFILGAFTQSKMFRGVLDGFENWAERNGW